MATVNDWNKYLAVVQELAQVEDDLRDTALTGNQRASAFAQRVLFERFGVDFGYVEG
jgi:hypothetical protein